MSKESLYSERLDVLVNFNWREPRDKWQLDLWNQLLYLLFIALVEICDLRFKNRFAGVFNQCVKMIKPIPKISDRQWNSNGSHVMFQINQLFNFNIFQCNHIARLNFRSSTIIIGNSCRLVGKEISGWKIVRENWNTGNRLIRADNSWCSTNNIFIWDHVWHVCNLHSLGFDIEKLKI